MKQVTLISGIIFVMLILLMYLFQRQLIYFPSQEVPQLHDYQANDMRVITLNTQDGLVLNSWYKPAKTDQPTVLYLHGNAGHIGGRMALARQFMDAGLGLLLLEYRGYGGNKGRPSEKGLYEDGLAGMRFLHQRGIKSEHIALYGESLGTGVATKLAVENRVCAVVLQSPYTSLSDLARYHYPWLLFNPWDRFNSIDRIQAIHAPLLILHGIKDDVVPYSQGQALFQRASKPKKMLSFILEGHHTMWNVPNFSKNIVDFIDGHCT
jgi:fermentation-respiration switch protein FrsA (DUF1100 family)